MALADYFERNALAASQVLAGFDETTFREVVTATKVGISFGAEAAACSEGRWLLDMTIRVLARLYPTLVLRAPAVTRRLADDLANLALAINPRIQISESSDVTVGVAVGSDAISLGPNTIFAGSSAWDALLSTTKPRHVGSSEIPFGAGAAACLACANVFRTIFVDVSGQLMDVDLLLPTMPSSVRPTAADTAQGFNVDETVLVGLGAIGNAATWALARTPLIGRLHLIDDEAVELSNLQRYVLTTRRDDGRRKVDVASAAFSDGQQIIPHDLSWESFVATQGYRWPRVLVAVDSARDRRVVQASLPKWIANAWTQPGDLGVSVHRFDDGACLSCLYLPTERGPSEDTLIASALGVPERLMQIRQLLYYASGTPPDLLEGVAKALDVPIETLLPFESRSVRDLYVEGICGGAVIELGRIGAPRRELHVPMAHQSALAGVLLASALVRNSTDPNDDATAVTRLNVLSSLGSDLSQPAQKDPRGICICQDPDYLDAYRAKWRE